MEVEEILINLGFSPKRDKNGWRMTRIHENGDNPSALLVYDNGNFIDFVNGEKGNLAQLCKRVLNITDQECKELLNNKYQFISKPAEIEDKIKMPTIFPPETLNSLLPIHDYWLKRGISLETIQKFGGGLCMTGSMKMRYVLPIWNSAKKLCGLTGRCTYENRVENRPKWRHSGKKSEWVYPAFLNGKILQQKREVILVESPANAMSLIECGINNVLVTFGTDLGLGILNYLLKIDAKKIIISLDNDGAGNEASIKMYKKLLKYFDSSVIQSSQVKDGIKDWNDALLQDKNIIRDWYKSL